MQLIDPCFILWSIRGDIKEVIVGAGLGLRAQSQQVLGRLTHEVSWLRMHIRGLPVWWGGAPGILSAGGRLDYLIKPRVIGFYSKDKSRLEETRLTPSPAAHLSPRMVLSASGSEDVLSWNREPGQGYTRLIKMWSRTDPDLRLCW